MNWTMHPGEGVAELSLSGSISAERLLLANHLLPSIPGWSPDFNVLIEIDPRSDLSALDLKTLKGLQARLREVLEGSRAGAHPRTAILCGASHQRPIAWLWSFLTEEDWPVETAVFGQRRSAFAWLRGEAEPVAHGGAASDGAQPCGQAEPA